MKKLWSDIREFTQAVKEWKEMGKPILLPPHTLTTDDIFLPIVDDDIQEQTVYVVAEEPEFLPVFKTEESAGADVRAYLHHDPITKEPQDIDLITLQPGMKALISLGIRLYIPRGFEIQIRSRSGLSSKFEIVQLTGVSTIDSDYRGFVSLMLKNISGEPFDIKHGDRIAQFIFARVYQPNYVLAGEEVLTETARGEGGYGHTGLQ